MAEILMRVSGPPVLGAGEDLPAPPRQKRSLASQRQFLRAGRELFARQGFHATSIQDIASAAGMAAGAFYTYFRSKRQLLIVLMNELLERLAALDLRPKGGAGDVRAGLRRFLGDAFRADAEYYGVIRAWQEAALTDATWPKCRPRSKPGRMPGSWGSSGCCNSFRTRAPIAICPLSRG